MSKKEINRLVKLTNQEKMVFIKCGNFYKTYEEDAVIMWYLFKYKLVGDAIAFPICIHNDIISKLNEKGISAIVIDESNNQTNYSSLKTNTYKKYLNLSKKEIDLDKKISGLKYLLEYKIKNDNSNYLKIREHLLSL